MDVLSGIQWVIVVALCTEVEALHQMPRSSPNSKVLVDLVSSDEVVVWSIFLPCVPHV